MGHAKKNSTGLSHVKKNGNRLLKKFSEVQYRRKRVLSRAEERRLYKAIIPEHLSSMLKIFLNSGLRRQELLKLRWDDVDFENRQLYIRETKTAKSRYVPMNETLYTELMKLYEFRKDDDLVYVNPRTGKGFVCVRKAFRGCCERAQIKNLILPDLRRTFASRALEASASIITVKELLGHSSVKTTQLYTMTNQDEKRRAVALFEKEIAYFFKTKFLSLKNIDKFIYGSDWPGIKRIDSNVEAIKKLPLAEVSIRKILYENAARILGLK